MRVIFMGNPDFAVPSLEAVAESSHKIIAVVSNPPKRIGRGKKMRETKISTIAKALQIPLIQPAKLSDQHFQKYISWMKPDIFVVVAYKILPDKLLSIPQFGAINLHPSLLPKYRGAAPIQWALLNGDLTTAVTTISLSRKIDSGAILMQESVDVNDNDNYGMLSDRLSKLGANIVVKTLDELENNTLKGKIQDESKVTSARKIKPTDYQIDWKKSAKNIHNQIRAFSPFPGAFTMLNNKRIKIFSTTFSDIIDNFGENGEIKFHENQFVVQTGDGVLVIQEVQLEGKKRMKATDFLRGTQLQSKTILGD